MTILASSSLRALPPPTSCDSNTSWYVRTRDFWLAASPLPAWCTVGTTRSKSSSMIPVVFIVISRPVLRTNLPEPVVLVNGSPLSFSVGTSIQPPGLTVTLCAAAE